MHHSEIIYWETKLDQDEAQSADLKQAQHNIAADNISSKTVTKTDCVDLQYWRLEVIDLVEDLLEIKKTGIKAMEIGSGKGLASAYLSTKGYIDEISCLDYSHSSLEKLLPVAQSNFHQVNLKKIRRIFGSYNNIKEDSFHLIYAFGAIHNSKDLGRLFGQIFDALDEGGAFISSDMSISLAATVKDEERLNSRVVPNSEDNYGRRVTYLDASDHFRSTFDYIFHARKAGFEVFPYIFDTRGVKKKPQKLGDCFKDGAIRSFRPLNSRGRFDNLVLVCVKRDAQAEEDKLESEYHSLFPVLEKVRMRMNRLVARFLKLISRKSA